MKRRALSGILSVLLILQTVSTPVYATSGPIIVDEVQTTVEETGEETEEVVEEMTEEESSVAESEGEESSVGETVLVQESSEEDTEEENLDEVTSVVESQAVETENMNEDISVSEEASDEGEETNLTSGICGDNLTWKLENNILTISGTGAMYDFDGEGPWVSTINNIAQPTILIIEEGVTSIGDNAFRWCYYLTGELNIPDGVTSIGLAAFEQCGGLSGDLIIPDTVTEIEKYAFYQCNGFDGRLILSDNITRIESYTFYECSGFVGDLIIPEGVEYIGVRTFCRCGSFDGKLVIPNSMKEIEMLCFYECKKLKGDLVIPDSVEVIGGDAFHKCAGIKTVIMGKNVKHVGPHAFSHCEGVETIITKSTPVIISQGAFLYVSARGFYPLRAPGWKESNEYAEGNNTWISYVEGEASEQAPQIYIAYVGDNEIKYYEEIGYSKKNFALDVTALYMESFINGEETTVYEGVKLEVSLPDGLSFSDSQDVKTKEYKIGTMDNSKNLFKDCKADIYFTDESFREAYDIQIKLTAEGYGVSQNAVVQIPVEFICEWDYKESVLGDFNYYTYRADYLINDENSRKRINEILDETSSCESITDGISRFESFLIEFWRGGMGFKYVKDPKTLIEYQITSQDLYLAVILDVVKQTEKASMVDNYSKTEKLINNWYSSIKDTNENITYNMKLSSLSENEKDDISHIIKKVLEDDKEWQKTCKYEFDEVIDSVDKYVKQAKTLEDVLTQIQNIVTLYSLNADTKEALKLLYERVEVTNPDGVYFLGALDWAIECMEDPLEAGSIIVGKEGAEYLFDKVWEKIYDAAKKKSPAFLIAMLTYEAGNFGGNLIANTDEVVDEKLNCVIMYDVLEAVDYTCKHAINLYRENPSEENARLMLAMLNMMFRTHIVDRDRAIAFCKALDGNNAVKNAGKGLGKKILTWVFPDLSHSETIQVLEKEKDALNTTTQYILIMWVYQLVITHPDTGLYEYYYNKVVEAKEKVKNHIYTFACPVDVIINSENGESFVKGGIVHAEEDVVIVLEGEQKTVYITTDSDYEIILEGTDIGTMTATVASFNTNGGIAIDKIYREVPLTSDTSYKMNVSNVNEGEKINVLLDEDGENVIEIIQQPLHRISVVDGLIYNEERERYNTVELVKGDKVKLIASTRNGYQFTGWSVEGDAILENYTASDTVVTVGESDSVIIANYEKIKEAFIISAIAETGGYILLSGEVSIEENTAQKFFIVPGVGYRIDDVQVDGKSVGAVDTYFFENVNSNHTISAFFSVDKEVCGDVLTEDIPEGSIENIPDGIWIAGIDDQTFTGSSIKQSFRVYDGKKRLKQNTDYTITYKNNKNAYTYTDEDYAAFEENLKLTGKRTKVGTFDPKKAPQITVKMKGNYFGSRVIYFKIEKADITGDAFETDNLTVTYTGKKQTPAPKLTWNGKALKYGTDFYIPEYDAAKKDKTAFKATGTYNLTITGKKNFTGEIPITLTISESAKQIAMNKVKVTGIKNMPWNGDQIVQNGFSVKYGKDVLSEENGDYTIEWGENTDAGTGTVTFIGTGTDEDGDGFSYIGSKKVSFKINGTAMSKVKVSGVKKSYPYTGNEIKPEASLTYKPSKNAQEIPLTEGTHYTAVYQKNVDKGTATILFTGLASGGYTGTKKVTFKITSAGVGDTTEGETTIENIHISFADTENIQDGVYVAPYMKGGAKPEVIVTSGDKTLEAGKDYKISYSNNKKPALSTDAKAPTVTVTGKGNYRGSKSETFTIEAKTLSNENGITVVVKDKVENLKKNGYRQSFKVYDKDGKTLGNMDYDTSTVTYTLIRKTNEDGTVSEVNEPLDKNSIVPAGSVIKITVQGKGIYAGGEASGTYRILEKNYDISKATIQINNQPYTGNAILITDQSQFKEGKVFIKMGNQKKELILGQDIEVVRGSYVKNVNKGTAKVTFRGINDFGGTKTVSFKIGARSITDFWKGIYAKMAELWN